MALSGPFVGICNSYGEPPNEQVKSLWHYTLEIYVEIAGEIGALFFLLPIIASFLMPYVVVCAESCLIIKLV